MPNTPLVTVVIPLFNKRHTIERAVRSVTDQLLEDWELIVVDDGSTDGSADALTPFLHDPRITLIRQQNAGPGAARNAGAALARGTYLSFLDADDQWLPRFLKHLVATLERHRDATFACAAWHVGNARRSSAWQYLRSRARWGRWRLPRRTKLSRIKFRIDAAHSSACVVRASEFWAFGGFYDRDRCTYGEDAYLWSRMIFAGKAIWATPRTLVRFHVDDGALSVRRKDSYPLPPVLSNIEEVLRVAPPERRDIVTSYLEWYARWVSRRALTEGDERVAADALKIAEHIR